VSPANQTQYHAVNNSHDFIDKMKLQLELYFICICHFTQFMVISYIV